MLNAIELERRLISSGYCRPEEIVGCTDDDIRSIESAAGLHLPNAYRSFLLVAGRGAGRFCNDLTIFYPDVATLTESTRRNFDDFFELPEKAFVFVDRMGESFAFFIGNGSDDPPIYGWSESKDVPEKVYDSIWEFLEEELEQAERRAKWERTGS